jgi:hypothetical protein
MKRFCDDGGNADLLTAPIRAMPPAAPALHAAAQPPLQKIFIKDGGQTTPLQPMVNFTSPDRPYTPSFIGDFVADPSELTPAENGFCPQPTLQSDRHQRTVAREGGARRAHQPQAQRVLFPDDSEYLLESYHRSLQGDLLAFPVAFGKRLLAMIDDPNSWVPEEDKPYVRRLARALVYGAPLKPGPGNFPHSDVEVRCAIAMMLMGAATGQIPKNNEALVAMFHEKFPGLHLTAKTVLNRIG